MLVLSYVGILGNEKDDSIAISSLSAIQIKSITLSESFTIIQNKINKEWEKYWTNLPLKQIKKYKKKWKYQQRY